MSGESDTRAGRGSGLSHVSQIINAALAYRAPCYSPPYDSPIEDSFAYSMVKFIDPAATLEPQVEVPTFWGLFRIDFAISTAERTIGVECDGQEFHQGLDAVRDEWRDAIILGTGSAQAIYRLRGRDIYGHLEDLLFLMSHLDTHMFSDRGRGLLRQQASDAAMESTGDLVTRGSNLIFYRQGHSISHAELVRRQFPAKGDNGDGPCGRLPALFEFAQHHRPASIDDLIAAYWEKIHAA